MHRSRRATRPGLSVTAALLLLVVPGAATAQGVTVNVPGTSNLWLAGMPDGTRDGPFQPYDTAPAQSPVGVEGLGLAPGSFLSFRASGGVTNDSSLPGVFPPQPPDGGSAGGAHTTGAANGIARVQGPLNALIGVFLGPDRPDLTPAPTEVFDFGAEAARDYVSIDPLLKQPFFIGDGLRASGAPQLVRVPDGAARLFLGTSDSVEWRNNGGEFTVTVVPEPSAISGAVLAATCLALRRRR